MYKIALKNLISQKLRTFLTTLGLCVGVASLVIFTGLGEGLRQTIYKNILSNGPLTELTVQTKNAGSTLINLIPGARPSTHLSPENLQQIQKIPHVTKVYPEMNFGNISSLQISIIGQTFQTDTMIFGLPAEYIKDTLNSPELAEKWTDAAKNYPAEPYPAIISRRIIDLYNFTIATSSNLPRLNERDLTGINLSILPNQSTFITPGNNGSSTPLNAKLLGFSDKTSLVGVTVPIEVVEQLNKARDPNYQPRYLRLYVEIDSAINSAEVQQSIESMGLQVSSAQEQIKSFEKNFRFVTLGLNMISVIILMVAGLTIMNTFFSVISERKTEIGVFRALGATQSDIKKIFVIEAGLIGTIGGIIGIIIGVSCEFFLNLIAQNMIPDISNKPSSIFINSPISLTGIFILSIVLSTIFAIIPATKAARMEPLEALSK